MEHFRIRKRDGNIISCVKAIPGHPQGIVLAIHGFTSSKESATYRLLLDRLPAAGVGMVGIDLPGHGTEESAKETLRIQGAVDSIEAAEQYILHKHLGCGICYFGSSFGAYLIGLYISTREHAGRKVFWRSAAVNMPELFIKRIRRRRKDSRWRLSKQRDTSMRRWKGTSRYVSRKPSMMTCSSMTCLRDLMRNASESTRSSWHMAGKIL